LDPIDHHLEQKSLLKICPHISPDERVDFGNTDVVQLLNSSLDLVLVGAKVADEDQRVVVLDLLHGRLGRQRMLNDVVGIHTKEKNP